MAKKDQNNDLLVIGALLGLTLLFGQESQQDAGIFGGGFGGGGFGGDLGGTGSLLANDVDPTTDEDIGVSPQTESTNLNSGASVTTAQAEQVGAAVQVEQPLAKVAGAFTFSQSSILAGRSQTLAPGLYNPVVVNSDGSTRRATPQEVGQVIARNVGVAVDVTNRSSSNPSLTLAAQQIRNATRQADATQRKLDAAGSGELSAKVREATRQYERDRDNEPARSTSSARERGIERRDRSGFGGGGFGPAGAAEDF